jgi:TPR repeat protein
MRVAAIIAALVAAAPLPAAPSPTVRSGIEAWQQGHPEQAVAIWRSLAEKGDNDAAFNLGQAYRLGRGVAADSGQAQKWFEQAARAGHLDAEVSLGLLLFDSGDRATALSWLAKAAQRGEPRAMLVTGTALFNGDGMKRDPILGYAYVSRAAAEGLAPAKATLADMDKVMPIADRRKGVAMAIAAHSAQTTHVKAAPPPKMAATIPPSPAPVPSKGGGWRVQLGAFGTRGAAQALFGKLGPKLGGAQPYYVAAGAVTRLQAGPFASRGDAASACARLKPQPCFPVAGN